MFVIGTIIVVAAITKIRFAILLPTTAPSAKSEWLFKTALILLASSGREVPAATITTPMAKREIFSFFPKLTDPLIKISAPKTRIAKPSIKINISTNEIIIV